MDNTYVIMPIGGLCNYLRVLFSYYKYCQSINKHLICIWRVTSHCPGFFLDYFEPLKNATIIPVNNNYKIDHEGFYCHPNYESEKMFIYDELKLRPEISNNISNIISKIPNNFTAIHLRRTDHIPLATSRNVYLSESAFIDYCKEQSAKAIYLATDNNVTQAGFKKIFKDDLYYYEQISSIPYSGMRFTDLKHSIIDLFVCVEATSFMGTPDSSFSELISQLRAQRRK